MDRALNSRLYNRKDPQYRRRWGEIERAGICAFRCGRHKGNSDLFGKGCSLPQGHRGKCDFTVISKYDEMQAKKS